MTTEPTLDDLMIEHQAEKAEVEAAYQRKLEQEREEHRRIVNRATAANYQRIANALSPDMPYTINPENADFHINGINVRFWIDFVRESSQGRSWKTNGKTRITVGQYGSRVSYPQKKDGTHNYSAIASTLQGLVSRQLAIQDTAAKQAANKDTLARVRKEMGLRDYTSLVRASVDPELPVVVDLREIGYGGVKAMSAARAIELAEVLKGFGFKL